jgi:predicted Rossmann fold nucleotide-binding protein DprA/Smf involved in DNA uptake
MVHLIQEIEAELALGDAVGARLLVLGDPDYPAPLAALDAPAPVLWTRGNIDLLARDAIALVGARVASAAGQKFAQGLAVEIGTSRFRRGVRPGPGDRRRRAPRVPRNRNGGRRRRWDR